MSTRMDDARNVPPISTASPSEALEFDQRPDKMWMNPIALSTLQRAVKRNQKTVLLNGREFSIEYGIYFDLPASGERREMVKLKRTDGSFVPFGYIAMKRIKEFTFEGKD